jgi:glutathione S-transferase
MVHSVAATYRAEGTMRCHLIALPYSPWSEKARWALDHHRVNYHETEHIPLLGGPLLRWRLRRPTGRVTVPAILFDGGRLTDSFAIARWADAVGHGEPLIPPEMADAIAAWNERSETVLDAGRALLVGRVPDHREALIEALPSAFPRPLRPKLVPIAAAGMGFLEWKYSMRKHTIGANLNRIRVELRALRDVLAGTQSYVLGRFTYADIVMAAAMQVFKPVANGWLRIGPETRDVWTEPELAEEFGDLVAWRDWVYERHR